jgi:hypothetical protein
MEDDYEVTKHAKYRARQRRIPDALIKETIAKGKKSFLADRGAYEYRLNNVLGFRGRRLVVITGMTGEVITCFVESVEKCRQYRLKRERQSR